MDTGSVGGPGVGFARTCPLRPTRAHLAYMHFGANFVPYKICAVEVLGGGDRSMDACDIVVFL